MVSLYLSNCLITDYGILDLHMTSLTILDLSANGISDLSLAKLSSLTSLQQLTLSWTKISGSGFASLPSSELRFLDLRGRRGERFKPIKPRINVGSRHIRSLENSGLRKGACSPYSVEQIEHSRPIRSTTGRPRFSSAEQAIFS
ncbi:MAG: leucine-rich repeat domain-containing protein [Anaerolineales bacterium]